MMLFVLETCLERQDHIMSFFYLIVLLTFSFENGFELVRLFKIFMDTSGIVTNHWIFNLEIEKIRL